MSEKWASSDDKSMPELVSDSDSSTGSEDYFTTPGSPDEHPPVPPPRLHQYWVQLPSEPSESSDQDSASGSSAGPPRHSEASLAGSPAGSETPDQDSASYRTAPASHVSSDEDHMSELSEDLAPKPPSGLSLQGSTPESPFSSSHYKFAPPESTLPVKTVDDDVLSKGMKVLGALVLSAGVIYGVKMIMGPVYAHPYVSALFPPSPADI